MASHIEEIVKNKLIKELERLQSRLAKIIKENLFVLSVS